MTVTGPIEGAAARVRALWDEGLSLAAIAERLGCSKGAVARFVRRHGLPPRPSPIVRVERNPPLRLPRPPTGLTVVPLTALGALMVSGSPGHDAPRYRGCQWPHGDPGTKAFHFCGASPVVEGRPYCAAHTAIAYVRHPRMPAVAP